MKKVLIAILCMLVISLVIGCQQTTDDVSDEALSAELEDLPTEELEAIVVEGETAGEEQDLAGEAFLLVKKKRAKAAKKILASRAEICDNKKDDNVVEGEVEDKKEDESRKEGEDKK